MIVTARNEDDKWKSQNTKERDIIGIIGFVEGAPVCFGFVYPPLSEMHFEGDIAKERRLFRHASDVYSWIDQFGSAQWCHPNGTYATIAENPDKLDLTGKDYDKIWKIKRNLKRIVHFVFSFCNNGGEKANAHIEPDGDTSYRSETRIYMCVGPSGEMVQVEFDQAGTATITAETSVTVKAPLITLDAPIVKCTGDVIVDGDVVASGKSLKNHVHTGVESGDSLSGPPA